LFLLQIQTEKQRKQRFKIDGPLFKQFVFSCYERELELFFKSCVINALFRRLLTAVFKGKTMQKNCTTFKFFAAQVFETFIF